MEATEKTLNYLRILEKSEHEGQTDRNSGAGEYTGTDHRCILFYCRASLELLILFRMTKMHLKISGGG